MSATAVAQPGAAGSKGLKTGALGFISNVVIGVASTAPAYSLAVSLGLVAAAVGIASPAIMWLAFLPDALHRDLLLLHEPRGSRLRHQLHLGDHGDGAAPGLDDRLGDHRRRRHRHGQPGRGGGPVHLQPVRRRLGQQPGRGRWSWASQTLDFAVIGLGVLFIAVLTWIVLRRDRAVRPDPGRPAGDRAVRPGRVLGRRPLPGLHGSARRDDRADARLAEPVQRARRGRQLQPERPIAPGWSSPSSSTGAGIPPPR